MEHSLKEEVKTRQENEKEVKAAIQAQDAQLKVYMDETADTLRKMLGVRVTSLLK